MILLVTAGMTAVDRQAQAVPDGVAVAKIKEDVYIDRSGAVVAELLRYSELPPSR